ncbi:MAG: hypothetical protein ACTSUE_07310 [Promethearchaeota archaeon]
MRVEEVSLKEFIIKSRFLDRKGARDFRRLVKQATGTIKLMGGFHAFLVCRIGGVFAGSMLVFKDPLYCSRDRSDVGCFGLVTATKQVVLVEMLEKAIEMLKQQGASSMRGPVNIPRALFGYGVQVFGFELPAIAGSSVNDKAFARLFLDLERGGYFNEKDVYYNYTQDAVKTREYLKEREASGRPLYRDYKVEHPVFDFSSKESDILAEDVAALLNESLSYRPDFYRSTGRILKATALQFSYIDGGEEYLTFLRKDKKLVGVILQQPDWFQVINDEPITRFVADTFVVAPELRGKGLMMNFMEHQAQCIESFQPGHFEYASIWKGAKKVTKAMRKPFTKLVKGFFVYEKRF